MKTINLELSKRLAPYLENVETEWYYQYNQMCYTIENDSLFQEGDDYKTLTLEEAIEFVRNKLKNTKYNLEIRLASDGYLIELSYPFRIFIGEKLIEATEKMLEYLLDNELLGKDTKNL